MRAVSSTIGSLPCGLIGTPTELSSKATRLQPRQDARTWAGAAQLQWDDWVSASHSGPPCHRSVTHQHSRRFESGAATVSSEQLDSACKAKWGLGMGLSSNLPWRAKHSAVRLAVGNPYRAASELLR